MLQVIGKIFIGTDRIAGRTIIFTIKELEEVAKDLCAVPSVDLFDHEVYLLIGMLPCTHISVGEDLWSEGVGYCCVIS